jgi:phosphate transport system protein
MGPADAPRLTLLERIGDHPVDIGEQTAFLVSGQFREFMDASH